MKKIIPFALILAILSMFTSCNDKVESKYPMITRTALWEIRYVNDSTLIAVPTSTSGDLKPILFNLSNKTTLTQFTEKDE